MTETDIRQGYKEHAALTQFYRWYQFYERPEGGIANALKRFALNLIQVWRDNAVQHVDVVRFSKIWVIQVFRKPL